MLTLSLCPICRKVIPAVISITDQIIMGKECPEHGQFTGIVETSPAWFEFCQQFNSPKIYDGFMIDVTASCNLECKYCYHDNTKGHRPVNEVLQEIEKHKHLAPIILTGGEPTIHPDFFEILGATAKTGQFWLLTNGINLSEPAFFQKALKYINTPANILMVGLSLHTESEGIDLEFLKLCRKNKKQVGTVFYVIDDLCQIKKALQIYDEYSDVICSMRIKAASNLGQETGAKTHIYTSQMIEEILQKGGKIDQRFSNKISYASTILHGKEIRLISWYDISNVDLIDIDGPPYCMSKDGNYYNLVTTCLKDAICIQ